jgi:hypothetical protein
MTMRSDTQSVSLPVGKEEAFAFLADPENLPRWAVGFARGMRREGEAWTVQTGQGEMPLRSTELACVGGITRPRHRPRLTWPHSVVCCGARELALR